MKICTKSEFLRRSEAGLLGNSMPSWTTVAEAQADGYHGPVMIRARRPNSPWMRPDVPQHLVDDVIAGLVVKGADASELYLTHMTPEVGRRLNAEVWNGPDGLYLNYSTAQCNVRDALAKYGRHAERAAALVILRWALCPNSFDDVMALLEAYPDAVIELTAYDREMGDLHGRNTIIWEVRDY